MILILMGLLKLISIRKNVNLCSNFERIMRRMYTKKRSQYLVPFKFKMSNGKIRRVFLSRLVS